MVRKSAVVSIAVAVMAMLFGAAPARADRPLGNIAIYSPIIATVGDHDHCRGSFDVGLSSKSRKPGVVKVTLTSRGFTGNGRGWTRNPQCRFLIGITALGSRAFYRDYWIPAAFGPRPGQKIVREVMTGSGLSTVAVQTYVSKTTVRTPQSLKTAFYLIVP